jgi:VWFA-related protein
MRRASLLPAAGLAAGLTAAPAAAQPVAVFSAETSLVNVAVTVEGPQGRPVGGLTARDFVLREDGERQRIEVCARMGEEGGGRSTSLDVALLVDASDSMLETLRRSQDAAVRFLTSLPNAQEIIVVFFDQTQRLDRFDRAHPEALFERVRTAPEGGNTALRDAIMFGLRALGTSNGRSAIVLLTDGIDTVSATDPPALEKAVQSHAVTIYPVAYPASPAGDGPDPEAALKELRRLAQISGGRLFPLPNEQALPGVFDEIVADLRAQYVLGFAPEATGPPGRLRKISVEVRGRGKVVVRHRVGYRVGSFTRPPSLPSE